MWGLSPFMMTLYTPKKNAVLAVTMDEKKSKHSASLEKKNE